MSSYTEAEIAEEALIVIAKNPGIRTAGLISVLRDIMKPDGDDLVILPNRNDDKFSQKVRNIKSHNSLADKVETIDDGHNDGRQWFLKNQQNANKNSHR